jgi:hypothetical protein
MRLSARTSSLRTRISPLDGNWCRLTVDYPDDSRYEASVLAIVMQLLQAGDEGEPAPESPPLAATKP